MLRTQVLQKITRKFDVSLLHMLPDNQALQGIFTSSCMWATMRLSNDEDDFKRAIENMELPKFETTLETVE